MDKLEIDIQVAEEMLEMFQEIYEERELEGMDTESIENKIIAQREYLFELIELKDRMEELGEFEYQKYEIIEGR